MAPSKLFRKLYQALPPESQCAFLQEHIAPLLDTIPPSKANRIIRTLKRTQARYDGMPKLDLRAKKREMQTLFRMLAKDDKIAFTPERSNREEILEEAVHSLSSWMNDIWTVVYEYRVNHIQAHECLIYALQSLIVLEDSPGVGDCKCFYNNIHVTVNLRDKKRRTVKYFSFVGPRNLDRVILWIWRDLFLTMLIEKKSSEDRVAEMLLDIEELMGWQGLERMLFGGKLVSPDAEYDSDYFGEEDSDEEDMLRDFEDVGTDDEFNLDSDGEGQCCYHLHAKYWPKLMNEEQITLREMVEAHLLDIFRSTPNAELFASISSISQDPDYGVTEQLQILSEVAGNSVDNLTAALKIHANMFLHVKLSKLLEAHYHYLRLNDWPALLQATTCLFNSPCRQQALKYVEDELANSIQHINAAVRSTFGHVAEEGNQRDLLEILKLPSGSPDRINRVGLWVDRCLTATAEPLNPMTFAAMMMGLPVGPPPSSVDETDLLAYIDFNKPDPDLVEIREEFRPWLKAHFDAWRAFAQTLHKDGSPILRRTYWKVIELMPFFRAPDIVSEMMGRIADRPSKCHIHDAMGSLLSFCKVYRKKSNNNGRHLRGQKKTGP